MPEGLKNLFAAPGRKKVAVILADAEPALYMEDYIHQVVNNYCKESGSGEERCHFHYFVTGVYDAESVPVLKQKMITFYDLVERSRSDIDELYQEFVDNIDELGTEGKTVIIIDDFYMFTVLGGDRNYKKLGQFLRKASTLVDRIFVFGHRESINAAETTVLYDVASAVAVLSPNSISGGGLPQMCFTCDLLTMKAERRVTHDQTRFQVVKAEIVDIADFDASKGSAKGKSQDEVLKNLTTFKLTLEDDEIESKNKLYLPYFDAQKTKVEDPDTYDDFEDDDEEV